MPFDSYTGVHMTVTHFLPKLLLLVLVVILVTIIERVHIFIIEMCT
jgi:hypothetical protein